jgi:hypothetical protein
MGNQALASGYAAIVFLPVGSESLTLESACVRFEFIYSGIHAVAVLSHQARLT